MSDVVTAGKTIINLTHVKYGIPITANGEAKLELHMDDQTIILLSEEDTKGLMNICATKQWEEAK